MSDHVDPGTTLTFNGDKTVSAVVLRKRIECTEFKDIGFHSGTRAVPSLDLDGNEAVMVKNREEGKESVSAQKAQSKSDDYHEAPSNGIWSL